MFLQIGCKRYQVATFEEASRMFCAARDKAGEGASRTPSPLIVDGQGAVIGHVSYNGRVWAGATYVSGAKPLWDNRKATMNLKTAHAAMSLHRKQMADALMHKGKEDMLGFEWAAFQHRQLMKSYAPAVYALWARQNPERAAQEANLRLFPTSVALPKSEQS
jgi:hypothetical protein